MARPGEITVPIKTEVRASVEPLRTIWKFGVEQGTVTEEEGVILIAVVDGCGEVISFLMTREAATVLLVKLNQELSG